MIYFQTNSTGQLTYIHYMPFDEKYGLHKTETELLKTGYLVESLPTYTGEIPDGKQPELRYDGSDFSWEMVDVQNPDTNPQPEPDLNSLKHEVETLSAKLSEIEKIQNAQLGLN